VGAILVLRDAASGGSSGRGSPGAALVFRAIALSSIPTGEADMTIVLVHGAWSGGWSWKDAARLLRQRGYEVYAPTQTGLAERSHVAPEHVDLSSHVADIAGLMRYEDLRDVLIVGHSYGGMVVTGAVDRERARVKGMIYLDAFVPHSGESLWDIAGPARAAEMRAQAEAYDGGKSVPRPSTPGNTGPGAAAAFGALFTPQPVGCMSEKYVATRDNPDDWPPRHYVLCKAYNPSPFHAIAARVKTEPGWTYGEFDALHDVPRTNPALVADMIARQAELWGIPGN
jgi:pimeloyl-ACP methyl ester carboxylesterase